MRSHAFVGRDDALAFLRERYYKATCGDGGGVILSGEASIGKSRLCEEFRHTVASADANVISTRSLDYVSSPFAPIVETVEIWLAERPHLFDVQVGLRDAVRVIARADDGHLPSAGERRRCFDSIARLFRIACADAPTTLIVDDLHEADRATLQLLGHVLGTISDSAFLLIATMRPIETLPSERRADLMRFRRSDNLHVFPLETLGTAAMHDLVLDAAEGRLDRATRSAIAARAAGNPLFAEELVRAALVTSERPAIVPISAADIAIERLERLSARDRTLLTFASVIGMEFSGSFLATMTETEPAAVYASIRTASALGLVEETDDPDVFRFRHGLTRDAVYAELLEIERRAMHRKVFEAMRAMPQPASIGAIAFHAHAAQDAPAAAYFGELAGDNAAANRAAAAACVFYERALAACVPASVGRLSEKLATARLAAGLPDLAEGPAREALRERLQANDVQGVLDAYVLLADIAAQSGADDARLATFEEMRRFLETIPDPSFEAFRALCESELAFADFDMDRVVAVSAAAAVRGASDAQVAITIANARAHALLARREYRSAIASQTLAVRRADRDGDPELRTAAHLDLGVVSMLSGDLDRASRSFRAAATIAEANSASAERALGLAMRSETELIRGNIALARQLLMQSLTDGSASNHPGILIFGGRSGIWMGLRLDDHGLTSRVVDSLDLERAMFGQAAERLHPLAGAFARYLLSVGRETEAHAVLRRAIDRLRSTKRYRITDWSFCSMITVAEIGHPDDIPHARRPLTESCAPFAPLFVSLFDAIVAERSGDSDAAKRLADPAIEPLRRYGFAFEAVAALALAGRKAEALEVAERSGFTAFARTLGDELRTRNRQGRSAAELTKREHAVAQLVAERLTNRLIADRLCVSEKTVETHLASIFTKLGVRARSEIGPALEAEPSRA